MADKCGAKRRVRAGEDPNQEYFCQLAAGYGTDHPGIGHCKFHFGATKAHRVRAQNQRAQVAVVTFGLAIDISPVEALLQEVHRTAGAVAYLQEVIEELDPSCLVQLDMKGKVEVPSVWVTMYQAERAHLVKVSAEAIKCGIEERRVKLAESQGLLLAQAVRAILEELGVANLPQTPEVVGRHLRLISADPKGA